MNQELMTLDFWQDTSALFPMAKEAALTMLEILSKTPPFSYMDIPKHRERIERVFTADNALKYVEFAIKAVTNSLPFEEVPKYADAVMPAYSAIPLYAGIWLTPLRNTKRRCLILQNNRTETKQTAPQRALRKCSAIISRRSFPSQRAMPGCLP